MTINEITQGDRARGIADSVETINDYLDKLTPDERAAAVAAISGKATAVTSSTPGPMSKRLRALQQHYAPAAAAELETKLAGLDDANFEKFLGDISRITGVTADTVTINPPRQVTNLPCPTAEPPRRVVVEQAAAAKQLAVDQELQDKAERQGEIISYLGGYLGVPDDTDDPEPVEASASSQQGSRGSVKDDVSEYLGDFILKRRPMQPTARSDDDQDEPV